MSDNVSRKIVLMLWFISLGTPVGSPLSAQGPKEASQGTVDGVIDIGNRRELFVDRFLIESLSGEAQQRLHHPEPREVVLEHDAPWEGSGSVYHSLFRDGPLYRMYYKAVQLDFANGKFSASSHPMYCCYAESTDGIHWKKPELGLVSFRGSKSNNIVFEPQDFGNVTTDPGHPAVFRDEHPRCGKEVQYKAILRAKKPHGLLVLGSPDGFQWKLLHPEPILRDGAFDSQNLAFYDSTLGAYRAYWRTFTSGTTKEKEWSPSGDRAIRTAISNDLIHWESTRDLTYEDSPNEQLYTNGIKPYDRAPHILLGFPTRYIERGWSPSMRALPELEHREIRAKSNQRYGTAITEGLVMASRDGHHFHRWNEAFLRPGPEREGTWNYGHHYLAWHLVETKTGMGADPRELSLYSTENFWTGKSSQLRRYALRLDGFVSIHAPTKGGELTTKPLRFHGNRLSINFASSASGGIRVEIQNEDRKAIPGFSLKDCDDHFGDALDRIVTWNGEASLEQFQNHAIRIRFSLHDADLFSFRFEGQ